MNRRDVLRQLCLAAATSAWRRVGLAATYAAVDGTWRDARPAFRLGVASGSPTATSVVLWTRLAPDPLASDGGMPKRAVPVRWELANDEGFAQVVQHGEVLAVPELAHSLRVRVAGLRPGRSYFYRFIAGGQASTGGRTRTAPAADAAVRELRLALTSCQHYEQGSFTVMRELAQTDLDLVVFVGDYIYTTEVQAFDRLRRHPHVFNQDLGRRNLSDYRQHHASYKLDADLQLAHARHPWLLVWDDHEVMADYAGDEDPFLADQAAFLAAREAAYQAYFEHLPFDPQRQPVKGHMDIRDQLHWGQLADLWLLDTRQFRDGAACHGLHAPMGGKLLWTCQGVDRSTRQVLGVAQDAWLAQGLAASKAHWKFIVQTTQMAPGVVNTPAGDLVYSEGWDAFPAARARIMQAIAEPRVQDVVILGGDVHRHVAANLRLDPAKLDSPIVASEVVGSSVTSRGLSELADAWIRASNPDILHLRSDERGYVLLSVSERGVDNRFIATAHPVREHSRFYTQAQFAIERGRAGLQRA